MFQRYCYIVRDHNETMFMGSELIRQEKISCLVIVTAVFITLHISLSGFNHYKIALVAPKDDEIVQGFYGSLMPIHR